jgi:hypothetical protein
VPRVWRARELAPARQPRWIARNRIPRSATTLLVGDEGVGKSLFWVWVTAAVTTGVAVPDFGIPAAEPGHVLLAAITEDDWCTTVLPRLEVAGADLDRVGVICVERDGSGAPTYPRDLPLITETDPHPDIVVVDGWLDTVPRDLNVAIPQDARKALQPWKDAATLTGAGMILSAHTNRENTAHARNRYGVTSELRKVARMTLFAQQVEEEGQLTVGPEKANGTALVTASMFTIGTRMHFDATADDDGMVPCLRFGGASDMTAREHVAAAHAKAKGGGGDSPVLFLSLFLSQGPRWTTDIDAAGERFGHSSAKLRAAKRELHVVSERREAHWFWRLPQHAGQEPENSWTPPGDQDGRAVSKKSLSLSHQHLTSLLVERVS